LNALSLWKPSQLLFDGTLEMLEKFWSSATFYTFLFDWKAVAHHKEEHAVELAIDSLLSKLESSVESDERNAALMRAFDKRMDDISLI
jgi:hypothetical protein